MSDSILDELDHSDDPIPRKRPLTNGLMRNVVRERRYMADVNDRQPKWKLQLRSSKAGKTRRKKQEAAE